MNRLAKVSGWAREVVAKRVLIVAAAVGAADFLVQTGLIPDDVTEQTDTLVSRAIYVVGLVGAIFWARSGTTPADPALAPKSTNGVPLVETRHAGGPVLLDDREDLRERLGGYPGGATPPPPTSGGPGRYTIRPDQ